MTDVGQLFVSLGVKGADKTVGAIDATKKGMSALADTSFETKAALVGAMYALERLFAASGKSGTDLTNFSAILGTDMVQMLQKYQYAARQVGVSNDEVASSFKGLQSVATDWLMGKAPEGLARVALVTRTTGEELQRLARAATQGHPEELLQKLQQYAQLETNSGLRNRVLNSFRLGDGMQAALARQAFRPEVLAKAPTYSNNEIASLDRANIAWSNLGNTIQMAIGHFNAKHGGDLVKGISEVVPQVIKVAEAFEKLADKVKLFDKLSLAFKGWAMIFDLIAKNVDKLDLAFEGWQKIFDAIGPLLERLTSAAGGDKKAQADLKEAGSSFLSDLPAMFKELKDEVLGEEPHQAPAKPALTVIPGGGVSPHAVAPAVPAQVGAGAPSGQTNNIEINQTFNQDVNNPRTVQDASKRGVVNAMRQMSALSGGQ